MWIEVVVVDIVFLISTSLMARWGLNVHLPDCRPLTVKGYKNVCFLPITSTVSLYRIWNTLKINSLMMYKQETVSSEMSSKKFALNFYVQSLFS